MPGFVSDSNVVMDRLSIDGTRVTLAAWRTTTGQDTHSIIATPAMLFANAAGNDYHLSATSPARDAGATVANVTEDLEGAPRPQGSAYDIGACEFPASTAPVTLTVTRPGNGTVTSAPAGIACGTGCSAMFTAGTSVTLTAAGGSVFSGWSGGGCAGTGTCAVTATRATTITATFASASTAAFPLGVTVSGSGTGTVTSAPAGLTCSTVCSASFVSGSSVVLTATAGAGSAFTDWSGACSGNGSCTVVLDQARAVTARFRRVFTDATLTPGSSVVRAAHFTELRGAIDTLRSSQALAAFAWTDTSLAAGATMIRQIHLAELRSAAAAVYAARGLTAPAWTDATITARATIVRAVHITELRAAVLALE